jgi:hypothetical protein
MQRNWYKKEGKCRSAKNKCKIKKERINEYLRKKEIKEKECRKKERKRKKYLRRKSPILQVTMTVNFTTTDK